jgi:hypothetical protein
MSIVKPVDGFFPITSVHRDDLAEKMGIPKLKEMGGEKDEDDGDVF